MRRHLKAAAVLVALAIATLVYATDAIADNGGDITGVNRHEGGIVIRGTSDTPSTPGKPAPVGTSPEPATRSITCNLTGAVSAACQAAADACLRPPLAPPTNAVVIEQQQPNGTWRRTGVDCDGNGAADALIVTPAMVRQEVVRLLPPVAVGVAPADGPTLVNLETIFWSPTAAQRQLGPVTILGQRVAITIRFDHATYDFGDGASATVRTPGTPWSSDICDTAQCPTLDGHTYTRPTEALTASSRVTWTASFTVGGGAAQAIPGTIDGPASQHQLQVREARSVIVR